MTDDHSSIRRDRYPESEAFKVWLDDDATLSLVRKAGASEEAVEFVKSALNDPDLKGTETIDHMIQAMQGHFCGYARFPHRLVKAGAGEGLLPLVPAHGGIDYVEEDDDDSVVYGFSIAHSGDFARAWTDEYAEGKVIQMTRGLRIAAKYEPLIDEATQEGEKRRIYGEFVDALAQAGLDPSVERNLPLMLRVLDGLLRDTGHAE